MTPPQFPVGPFEPEEVYGEERRRELIRQIEAAPADLRAAVAGLSEAELDTPYKNWTIRQIVHHVADSHVNAYVRFKLTLTEERPTVKPYDEGLWAALPDSRAGGIGPTLALLDGLHGRWAELLRALSAQQLGRAYFHPEYQQTTTLAAALAQYAWHGRHHTGQILWLRENEKLSE